ncbi:MAG: Helix-turn-helix domain [Pyrinomonadaceae bacterium]|nr:Helix-turn-helix domain [Pyrinomonadaceae bacterium]
MGNTRSKPERLGEKLRQIRLALGLSQAEMLTCLGAGDLLVYNQLSGFESGAREPSLRVLLEYARAANVSVEALIDDELDLPDQLPSPSKHEGVSRKPTTRARKR